MSNPDPNPEFDPDLITAEFLRERARSVKQEQAAKLAAQPFLDGILRMLWELDDETLGTGKVEYKIDDTLPSPPMTLGFVQAELERRGFTSGYVTVRHPEAPLNPEIGLILRISWQKDRRFLRCSRLRSSPT